MIDAMTTDKQTTTQNKPLVSPWGFAFGILMQFKWLVLGVFIFETLQAIAVVMMPFAIRGVIDALESYNSASGQPVWDSLREPFLYFVTIAVAAALISRIAGTLFMLLDPKIRIPVRRQLFRQLQFQSIDYFSNRMGGSFGNKINEVASGVAASFWTFMFSIWSLLIVFTTGIALTYSIHPMIANIIVVWGVIYTGFSVFVAFPSARLSESLSRERSYIAGRIIDVASNIVSMKAFASDKREQDNLEKDMQREMKYTYKFRLLREVVNWMHFILSYGLLIICMYFAVDFFQSGDLTVGAVAFIFTMLLTMIEKARMLGFRTVELFDYMGQIRNGVKTIMTPVSVEDKPDAKDLTVTKGRILLDHVDFKYPSAESGPFLQDFTLDIKGGMKIGLVGSSGAGKSTLVNLLLRFYDIQSGKICIDGQNIADVTQNSLREQIAFIPQDTALFHRSLLENIRYGKPDASDEEVIEAAKKAYIHDFIDELPEKYHTYVGERGVKLSGGQRQRIAIARAILKDAPILILDEATSALDSESEKLIQAALADLMKDKTVIAIAHRLSTIASLDRLLVMHNGAITEDGTHAELLKKDGLYARLWGMQSDGFLREEREENAA